MGPDSLVTRRVRQRWWRGLIDVRVGERRDVFVALATLFSFMCGHGVLETGRDALFLSRLPSQRLPWVYLAMAVACGALSWLGTRASAPRAGVRRLSLILGAGAVVTTALAFLTSALGNAGAYAIYVWTGLIATFGTVELWQLLGDRFTADQAKRLYGPIGSGAIAGVVAGSSLAAVLAAYVTPSSLLFVGAAFSVVAAASARLLSPGRSDASDEAPRRIAPLTALRVEPHARRLLYLVLLSNITLTIISFLFKSHVAAAVAPERLGVFFGWFSALVNALALLVQVAFTSLVLRKLGTVRSLALLPGILVAGGALYLAMPLAAVIAALSAFDGVARYSVLATAMEILFLPLPRAQRHALKALIKALGQRGGQAFASAGILIALALGGGPRTLATVVVVLALLWLAGLTDVRRKYVALFRTRLRDRSFDSRSALPDPEREALEAILDRDPVVADAAAADDDDVPSLLERLAPRASRERARLSLLAIGEPAARALGHALESPATAVAIRRHLPKTLSLFATAESARILVDCLVTEPDGMTRFKILSALASICASSPGVDLDVTKIQSLADATLLRAGELLAARVALAPLRLRAPTAPVLCDLLFEKKRHAMNRLFLLLALMKGGVFDLLDEGFHSEDPKLRAASREVLTEELGDDMRRKILLLLEDVDDAEQVERLGGEVQDPIAVLLQLAHDRSEPARLLARRCRSELAPQVPA